MTNDMQDERYTVVDEAIRDAFFLILKEKELEKITVSDIIKRAGIVRSTFYNHYENIPAHRRYILPDEHLSPKQ